MIKIVTTQKDKPDVIDLHHMYFNEIIKVYYEKYPNLHPNMMLGDVVEHIKTIIKEKL